LCEFSSHAHHVDLFFLTCIILAMDLTRGNSLFSRIIIFLSLCIAVISFSLAAAEPIRSTGVAAERTGIPRGETFYYYPGDAGEPVVVSQAGDSDDTNHKKDKQRFFSFFGVKSTCIAFFASRYKTNQKYISMNSKETILLKLRI